eukprot:308251_1
MHDYDSIMARNFANLYFIHNLRSKNIKSHFEFLPTHHFLFITVLSNHSIDSSQSRQSAITMRAQMHNNTRHRATLPTQHSAFTSISTSVQKSIKNLVNASKKDDDLFSGNDIQGRRRARKTTSFLYKVANTNPLFLIICGGFCVVLFIVSMVFVFSAVAGHDNSNYRNTYTSSKTPSDRRARDNPLLKAEITRLLDEMRGAKDDIEGSLYHTWDQSMSKLMHKHCLNELPFELQSTAKNTLEAHISYLFEALLEHEKVDSSLSSGDVMVTELGTLIDGKSPGPIKSIQYAPCTLVKELLKEAEMKHLLKKFKKGFADFFSKTNDDVWMENKEKFVNQDVNQAAFELISLAKSQGDKSHIAKQLIAKLLNSFCPNIKSFFKKQDTDKDLMFEVVNSIEDLLTQLKHQGTIHIGKHEIPAIDTGGFLVAVDKFSLNEEESFEDKWVSCVFVDKLVYITM